LISFLGIVELVFTHNAVPSGYHCNKDLQWFSWNFSGTLETTQCNNSIILVQTDASQRPGNTSHHQRG